MEQLLRKLGAIEEKQKKEGVDKEEESTVAQARESARKEEAEVKANKTWKINAICLTLVQALYRPLNPGETRSSIATRCQVLLPHGVPKGLEKLVVEFSGTTTMALAASKKQVQTGSMCFVIRVGWR